VTVYNNNNDSGGGGGNDNDNNNNNTGNSGNSSFYFDFLGINFCCFFMYCTYGLMTRVTVLKS
jgi:hypothetical protein